MIEINHLTKRFEQFTAVDDLSFQVAEGEVLGFLGPNGAGKSTTMKIIKPVLQTRMAAQSATPVFQLSSSNICVNRIYLSF